MEKISFKKVLIALLVALGITAIHIMWHTLLRSITTIWNPVFISLVVGILFLGVLYAQVEWNHKHIYRWISFAALAATAHFLAHVFASHLKDVPIVDNAVIGIAGTVLFVSVLVLEIVR